MKKVSNVNVKEYSETLKEIKVSEQKIEQLKSLWRTKKEEQDELLEKEQVRKLQRFVETDSIERSLDYPFVTEDLISQVIQAYRRSLIVNDPSIRKAQEYSKKVVVKQSGVSFIDRSFLPDTLARPVSKERIIEVTTESNKPIEYTPIPLPEGITYKKEQVDYNFITKKGIIMTYLELHDLNEYYYSIGQTLPDLYLKLKRMFVNYLNEYFDFQGINMNYTRKALDYFNTEEADTIKDRLKIITRKWPKQYTPQKTVVDYWERDLFGLLYNSRSPLDFYQTMIIRNYNNIAKENTKDPEKELRRPAILFNDRTGRYGSAAMDGRLFEVQFLSKDFVTGQPIEIHQIIEEKDPRTGLLVKKNVTTQKRGTFAFILRRVGTNQIGESKEVWMEVPKGSVKLYSLDYDACNRFTKKGDCKGPGMNGLMCQWKEFPSVGLPRTKCVSAFGKKKK